MRGEHSLSAILSILGLHFTRMPTMQLPSPVPMLAKPYYFQTKPVRFRTVLLSPLLKFRPVWPVLSALQDMDSLLIISVVIGILMSLGFWLVG